MKAVELTPFVFDFEQGMLKKRVNPEDVIINCSKDAEVPEPPEGHSWKEVRHDNSVTWLASWTENVQNQIKVNFKTAFKCIQI